jgi:hypothetical protein
LGCHGASCDGAEINGGQRPATTGQGLGLGQHNALIIGSLQVVGLGRCTWVTERPCIAVGARVTGPGRGVREPGTSRCEGGKVGLLDAGWRRRDGTWRRREREREIVERHDFKLALSCLAYMLVWASIELGRNAN